MASNQSGLVQQTRITRRPYFVGFNTVGQSNPPYNLNNIELVKRDLENHFATPLGARVMLPNFGTRIYEYLFDPFDEYTKNAIVEDAVNVIQSEPRVELVSIDVFQEDQALNILMTLLFKPESITDNLFVRFSLKDRESN
ncbi:MAG TPA: GPW/gp25 family protein [Ignavibacteriaceae bacterium]